MTELINVEVAYAGPGQQFLRVLQVSAQATIADAIRLSGVEAECGINAAGLSIGVWSKPADLRASLHEGDRVEIYRPLKIDPKEARRRRAKKRLA